MKNAKKSFLLVVSILLLSSLLIGCVVVPEEYTKGVRLDRDYPDDDMPIMDDAIVYYSDGDDEGVTIKYGVSEDLDDVVDFYKDHFDDNDIVLDDESDKRTKYSAEGYYEGFIFEIRVSEPSGEYEEKQYVTTVKIEIEFVDETSVSQSALSDNLIGFWRQESLEDEDGKFSTMEFGMAYEFLSDGTLKLYSDFELFGSVGWEVVNSSTFNIIFSDGQKRPISVTLENNNGVDYLILVDSTETYTFYVESPKDFVEVESEEDIDITPSTDEEIAAALADKT